MTLKKALLLLPIILPLLGGLIWMVQLEGRVNGHDDKFISHDRRFDEMKDDLKYVRERIDRALERQP